MINMTLQCDFLYLTHNIIQATVATTYNTPRHTIFKQEMLNDELRMPVKL